MSVSLVQGDIFQRAVNANAPDIVDSPDYNGIKHAPNDKLIADFNKAVTAYSTAHQQYIL